MFCTKIHLSEANNDEHAKQYFNYIGHDPHGDK